MSDQPDLAELQRNVHLGLGRALLRFQHLEQTLKSLVLPRFVAVAPSDMPNGFQKRRAEVTSSPLGWLKEELLGKLIRPQGIELDESEMNRAERNGQFAFRLNLSVSIEEHSRIERHLTIVHGRRNRVVHHFLDDFDLQSNHSCEAAISFLEETHGLLDTHQGQVIEFAKWAMQGLAHMAQAMQGPEFFAALLGVKATPEGKNPRPKSPKRRGPKNLGGRPLPN
jgi:hypothetical protein